jgi:FixJ family two-component response regulator
VPASSTGGAPLFTEPPLVAVVDDDPSVLRSLRSLLLSSGFRVQTFQSAAAFLAFVETETVSCLVLDLSMPEMSGLELVLHMNRSGRPVRFVVLTAVADADERERMMLNGATECLRKPASGSELLRAIRRALSGASDSAQ